MLAHIHINAMFRYRCLAGATARHQKELKKGNWFTGMFSSKDAKLKKQQVSVQQICTG